MNGRVYDTITARFTSADPFIQAPSNLQSYNRYSYVMNNPVNFTDPSGFVMFGWFGQRANKGYNDIKHWGQDHRSEVKQGVAIVAAVVTTALTAGGAAPGWAGFFSAVGAGAAGGAIMTGTLRGTLEGALWGGVTGGVAFGVAEGVSAITGINAHGASFFNGVNKASVMKAVAHGLSRTAIQQARYGTTKGAFLSGFISSGFSVGAGGNPIKGAFQMAIIGGTVSELGGGKFANGAMSSAFQYLLNDAYTDMMLKKAGVPAVLNGGDETYTAEELANFESNKEALFYTIAATAGTGLSIARYGLQKTAEFIFWGALEMTGLDTKFDLDIPFRNRVTHDTIKKSPNLHREKDLFSKRGRR